jgi:hypothetical protein
VAHARPKIENAEKTVTIVCEVLKREVLFDPEDNGNLSPRQQKLRENYENEWLCEDVTDSSRTYRLVGEYRNMKMFRQVGRDGVQPGDIIEVKNALTFLPDGAVRPFLKILASSKIALVPDAIGRRLTRKSILGGTGDTSALQDIVIFRVFDKNGDGTHLTALQYSNQFFGTCGVANNPASINAKQQATVVDQFRDCSGGQFAVEKWNQFSIDNDPQYIVRYDGVENDGVIDFKLPKSWSEYSSMNCGAAEDEIEAAITALRTLAPIVNTEGKLKFLLQSQDHLDHFVTKIWFFFLPVVCSWSFCVYPCSRG